MLPISLVSTPCQCSESKRLGSALAMLPGEVSFRRSVCSLRSNIGLQDSAMPSIKAVPLSAFISGPAGVDCIL